MKKNKDEASEKQGKGKMLIIFVSMFLTLSFLAGAGFYFISNDYIKLNYSKEIEKKYVDLGEFKINLSDTDKKRYFSGRIYIGYDKDKRGYEDAFKKDGKLPIIQDVINSYLREKSYDYLANADNTEKIKKEMIEQINGQLDTCRIEDIRFGEYLLQ